MTDLEFEQPSMRERLGGVARRVAGSVGSPRDRFEGLLERLSGTVNATRAGAHATTTALQKLPDPTLRSMASSSAAFGAGLFLAGKRRTAIAIGALPALVMGAAIALRPTKLAAVPEPKS